MFSILAISANLYAQENIVIPQKVRVRITSVSLPLNIKADGVMVDHMSLEGIKKASLIRDESIQIARNEEWEIQKENKTLKTSQEFLRIDSASGKVKINLFWYPTPLFLSAKSKTKADLILNLNFNDYLQGVIIGEMPSHWPTEALKAQAIAARSYALYQLKNRQDEVFHLEGNVLDQVYSLQTTQSKEIAKIVEQTHNKILVQNNAPLKAYYHSDCGGHTEEPKSVWGVGELKIGSTKDKSCSMRTKNRWSYKVSRLTLAALMGVSGVGEKLEIIKSDSGRAELISLNSKGKVYTISGQELRRQIGFDKLKSTLFSLTFDQNSVTFTGQGYGHGSGLCQWGARSMAQAGKTAEEILMHYYPLAKVSRSFEFENQGFKL